MDKFKEKISKVLSDEELDAILCKTKEAAAKIKELDMSKVSAKDMPDIFDLMKDTAETKMYLSQAKYYDAIVEAMEESDKQYGVDYDEQGMYNREKKYYPVMGYEPYLQTGKYNRDMDMMYGRMGYSSGSGSRTSGGSRQGAQGTRGSMNMNNDSRYGYSHDEYMNRRMSYSTSNPADLQKRKELLNERLDDLFDMAKEEVMDMSPEEKSIWRSKLTNILNM